MKKQGRKTGGSINKKLSKLDKETRTKTRLVKVKLVSKEKNLQNLAQKTGRKIGC